MLTYIINILLTNILLIYYQNEPAFNGVCSRNNLSELKHGVYIINLNGYESIVTHWIALYVVSFGVENIPKEIREFIRNRNITTSIYRIQAYDSIMFGNVFIGFINFLLKDKSLLEYTNSFSPN